MRILVLTSSYPTRMETVASPFLHDWADALSARGHELTVLAPCDRHYGAHITKATRVAVSYFQYLPCTSWQTLTYGAGMYDNVRRNPFRLAQLPSFLQALHRQAGRLIRDGDVLHAHWMFPAGLVGALVKRRFAAPLVISIHSTDFHALRRLPGGRLVARAIVRHADRLHFVTEYHRQRFAEWIGDDALAHLESYVAPMGVPDGLLDAPLQPLAAKPTIGFMGRLIPLKGVDQLLRACARLRCGRVAIAGVGPAQALLARLADALGVDARFVGAVSGAGKTRFLDGCDIMVFPSRHYASGRGEGLPVGLLEAMARGRVVVASDSGGIPEVIRHRQNGYLYCSRRRGALDDALKGVLSGWPTSGHVAADALLTGRRYTASVLASQHESHYRALLSRVAVPEACA